MTQVDTKQLNLITDNLWTDIYIKYGDTLYNKYRIIYLVVVKDKHHDCTGEDRESYREGLC